jgi:hypothetical protein
VRRGVDELTRIAENTLAHLMRPELAGNLEVLVDVDGLGDMDVPLSSIGV